jgi:Protein of unknown function (DUF1573)
MRFIIITICAVVVSATSCNSGSAGEAHVKMAPTATGVANVDDSASFTSIEWTDTLRNFGKITEGQQLDVTFGFKNTGSKPLVIYRIQPSCGCTAAEPPKEPIAPGGMGEIKATFNSSGKEGLQHKTLYVNANTKGMQDHELKFIVEVEKKQ